MQALRDELLETQKARTSLTRWKIVIIAATGAAAFKIGGLEFEFDNRVLLVLLPVMCVYVDGLIFHYAWRVKEIGYFVPVYSTPGPNWEYLRDYEVWLRHKKVREPFKYRIEEFAVAWATYVVCSLVFLAGLVFRDLALEIQISLWLSSLLGLITKYVKHRYAKKLVELESEPYERPDSKSIDTDSG